MSNELSKLLLDSREIYGEYKGYLKNMAFDYKCFLESAFINDIYYSFKIDNSKITKEDMFFMTYKIKKNEAIEFNNIKKALLLCLSESSVKGFSLELYNKIHKILFSNCKKDNLTKGSGHLRKSQTFLLKPGLAGSSVSFVPPVYTELNSLMKNLTDYMNNNEDDSFVSSALTHFQFEKLHPYISGNGKLGRLMIPTQLAFYKKEPPILFLSESIENLKNTYFTLLSSEKDIDYDAFIKFILQCIIEQCNINIKKIKKLNKIYQADYEAFKTDIGGTTIFKIYPLIIKKIVFTTSDMVNESKLHINSINKVLNKLVDNGYLIKQKAKGTNRVTFCYKNMYDVFVK